MLDRKISSSWSPFKKVLFCTSIGFSIFWTNLSGANLCETDQPEHIRTVSTDQTPNYFFRVFPTRNYLTFAGNYGNFIVNMDTGEHHEMPGPYDAVPLGENVVSIPGMTFLATDKLIEEDPTASIYDSGLPGVYQSVGLLSGNQKNGRFRVITASMIYQDYEINSQSVPVKMQEVGEQRILCSNLSSPIQLPMLSKDGTEISGIDLTTGTTKIWKIKNNGECTEDFDFGFAAGKADFSYTGRQLVFHVDKVGQGFGWFGTGSASHHAMDVFVLDRDTNEIRQLTLNTDGTNSYYPVYRADGTVMYINVAADGSASFVQVNPDTVEGRENLFRVECGEKADALLSLGAAWNEICHKYHSTISTQASLLLGQQLNFEQCKEVVMRKWSSIRDSIPEEMTKQDVLGFCSELPPGPR